MNPALAISAIAVTVIVVAGVVAFWLGPGGEVVEVVIDGIRRLTGRGRKALPPAPRIDDGPPAPGAVRWPKPGEQARWCPTCSAPVPIALPACPRCGRPVGQ